MDINELNQKLYELKEPYLKTIPVMDNCFVRLVDFMGSDQRIVQAARVSYGEGTKTVREDKGLIDYLLRHEHTSPFEQVEFTFHVKMPIFVARQEVRHRTACLSGDTYIWFDEPAAIKNGHRKIRKMKIKEFFDKWHNGSVSVYNPKRKSYDESCIDPRAIYTVSELSRLTLRQEESIRTSLNQGALKGHKVVTQSPKDPQWRILGSDWLEFANKKRVWRNSLKDILKSMNLRMCDESTGEILHTNINDIWSNGVKDVFEVTLENGYVIKMTKDHLCFSEKGWGTLEDLVGLKVSQHKNCSWSENSPSFCVNGVPVYQDYAWMSAQREKRLEVQEIADLAGCSYHTIRKWLKKHNLQYTSKEKSFFSGLKQRGTRRTKGNYVVSEETKQKIRVARSGAKSNFWKGGVSTEREAVSRWTTQVAHSVHKNFNFKCQVCGSGGKLHAHHIDPVWHNPAEAYNKNNLISLCISCHKFIHSNNLDLLFLEEYLNNKPLSNILKRSKQKSLRIRKSPKLARGYSKVKNIRYAGKEEVFDIEVVGPYHNFVANGFIVHNSINEISGRYSVMQDEFYVPDISRMQTQSVDNKQGSSNSLISNAESYQEAMRKEQQGIYANYEDYLSTGMARELARINLPLSTLTEFYWKIDLLNLFKYLRLRLHSHAQYEIRVIAQAKYDLIKPIVPYACESFDRHMINGARFSQDEISVLRYLFEEHEEIQYHLKEKGWKKSKIKEFIDKLQ